MYIELSEPYIIGGQITSRSQDIFVIRKAENMPHYSSMRITPAPQ